MRCPFNQDKECSGVDCAAYSPVASLSPCVFVAEKQQSLANGKVVAELLSALKSAESSGAPGLSMLKMLIPTKR